MTCSVFSVAIHHWQPAEGSLTICFVEKKLIDGFNEKARVKDTQLLYHRINLTDGRAVYLDHAWLRLHALHLCQPCLFDDLMTRVLMRTTVLTACKTANILYQI